VKKQSPLQTTLNLSLTSGKQTRPHSSGGLDKASNTGYTNTTMKEKQKAPKTQQLKHPDEQLWRQVKAAAAMAGKTMTEWVEEALKKQLAATKKSDWKGDAQGK